MISKKRALYLALILLALIGLPYLIAALIAGKGLVFGGFFFNVQDNNSYLAKMYEGWNGSWTFTLPYTANAGQGSYLFLYYLFLGHLAHWTGLSLMAVYQTARLVNSLLMLAALIQFFRVYLKESPVGAWVGVIWATFGSGLGWAVMLFGLVTADTWVSEAFPFLSAFAVPHFSLTLAMMLWVLSRKAAPLNWQTIAGDFLSALLLTTFSPFSIIILLVVLGGEALWNWALGKKAYLRSLNWLRLVWIGIGGGPMLLYQFWLTRTNPVLAGWNAQNLTLSPAIWNLVISFSPALLLAVWGIYTGIKANLHPAVSDAIDPGIFSPTRRLIIWAVLGVLLLYLPFDLQRRFILGYYIPLVALAILGLDQLKVESRKRLVPWTVGFSLGTNLILVAMILVETCLHDPNIYLSSDQAAALAWIRGNTPAHALVLAGSETGNRLPAYTGRRVVYGHPYETVNAAAEEQQVDDYFSGKLTPAQMSAWISAQGIDYIYCGREEQSLSASTSCPLPTSFKIVYQQGTVTVYDTHATTLP